MRSLPRPTSAVLPTAFLFVILLLDGCAVGPRPPGQDGTPERTPPESEGMGVLDQNPGGFTGLMGRDVLAKMGEPSYRRRETPAEIWQYVGQGCVLDLFLYGDKDAQKVTHAELRSHALAPTAQVECLQQLLAGKRGDVNS